MTKTIERHENQITLSFERAEDAEQFENALELVQRHWRDRDQDELWRKISYIEQDFPTAKIVAELPLYPGPEILMQFLADEIHRLGCQDLPMDGPTYGTNHG